MVRGDARAEKRRLTVRFEGMVQGVGFRYTTVQVAQGWGIGGYVRNEEDGSVLLVAEGGEEDLSRFVQSVKATGLGRYITKDTWTWSPATGEFRGFTVRHGY